MELTLFINNFRPADSIASFMDYYYSLQMKYLASDLLHHGLGPKQISEAVVKAINAGRASGLHLHQHFKPIYTGIKKEIISDCKLSHLAYGLVLINADVKLTVVSDFQLDVLQTYLSNNC